MTENSENPQKILSKQMMGEALIELMREKNYEKITITDLTEKAQLARRTFYRHFSTINEVLDYQIRKMSEEMMMMLFQQKHLEFGVIVQLYFELCLKHKDFLLLLQKNDWLFLLLGKFSVGIREKMGELTKQTACPISREYAFYFALGGLWNLLIKWLEDGAIYSPVEMAGMTQNIQGYLTTSTIGSWQELIR